MFKNSFLDFSRIIILALVFIAVLIFRGLFEKTTGPIVHILGNTEKNLSNISTTTSLSIQQKAKMYDELSQRFILGEDVIQNSLYSPVAIVMRPEDWPYGNILIGAGLNDGIKKGTQVLFDTTTLYGTVEKVFGSYSRVAPYSLPDQITKAYLQSTIPVEIIGRGGGSFKMELPSQIKVQQGDVVTDGKGLVLAEVVETISDSEGAINSIFLRTPYSINSFYFLLLPVK